MPEDLEGAIQEATRVSMHSVLTDVAKSVNSLYKDYEAVVPGTEATLSDVRSYIPTSSLLLNLLCGEVNQGVPRGRIIELFGDFSEGKSTIAQLIMVGFQKAGGISALHDTEYSWDRDRAVRMGHDSHRHLAFEADTLEEGFSIIESVNRQFMSKLGEDVPVVYCWDTIAASPPKGEKEGNEYEGGMMYKARKIRSELRRLAPEISKNAATLVFVNQTIDSLKKGKTTAGGGGLKFWSTQRLRVKKIGFFPDYGGDKNNAAGILTVVKAVKNKLAPPNREVIIPIRYDRGLDEVREVMGYLLDNTSVVNIAGAYRKIVGFADKDISFYERDTPEVFDKYPGLFEWLKEQVVMHWCGL